MNDMVTVAVAVGSFATGLAINLFIFGWKAKSVEANLRQDMNTAIAKLAETMRDEHDDAMAKVSKAVADLQSKVFEVEIWGRDNFVRRADFSQVIDGVSRSIESIGIRLDAAVLRIENKIEKIKESDRA